VLAQARVSKSKKTFGVFGIPCRTIEQLTAIHPHRDHPAWMMEKNAMGLAPIYLTQQD
jgi:hypothetical protein